MTRQELAQEWRERLDDFAQSGRSVVDWCYFNQVSVHQYYYWKRRFAAETAPSSPKDGWIPVEIVEKPASSPAATGVTVHIAGAAIQLTAGFDPATLRAVVLALAAIPC